MYYVYRDHLSGGFYTSTRNMSDSELYCDDCGNSDYLMGTADDEKELAELIEHLEQERDKEFDWEVTR